MGASLSTTLHEEDLNLNALHYPYGVWSYEKPKNFDYYFSKERFVKISRKHYPQFTRGYLYGYWEDVGYWDNIDEGGKEVEES
jgi:hypothetical protein